ncbi:unnamed protein product, partial [Nesidiocoris tenuis]
MDNTTTIRNIFGLRIHIISTELQILSSNSIRPPVPLGRRYHAFTFDRLSDEEILKNFRFRREDLPRLKRCLEPSIRDAFTQLCSKTVNPLMKPCITVSKPETSDNRILPGRWLEPLVGGSSMAITLRLVECRTAKTVYNEPAWRAECCTTGGSMDVAVGGCTTSCSSDTRRPLGRTGRNTIEYNEIYSRYNHLSVVIPQLVRRLGISLTTCSFSIGAQLEIGLTGAEKLGKESAVEHWGELVNGSAKGTAATCTNSFQVEIAKTAQLGPPTAEPPRCAALSRLGGSVVPGRAALNQSGTAKDAPSDGSNRQPWKIRLSNLSGRPPCRVVGRCGMSRMRKNGSGTMENKWAPIRYRINRTVRTNRVVEKFEKRLRISGDLACSRSANVGTCRPGSRNRRKLKQSKVQLLIKVIDS